jgi:hypothetical protein
MRKLALSISFCLAVVLGTLALSAAEVPSTAPAATPAVVQEATAITPILLSPQPLPSFMLPAAPEAGCSASASLHPEADESHRLRRVHEEIAMPGLLLRLRQGL